LAHISQREPLATVAIFPSDHCILHEERFVDSVRAAITETQRFPRELTLLGMTPTELGEDYGWIEPGEPEEGRGTRSVRRFWEKPPPAKARELLRRGALWNTFVGVARADTLWEMTRQAAPDLARDFTIIRRAVTVPSLHAEEVIARVYHAMRPVNFSTDICQFLTERLRVWPTPDVGWSDWGSVDRILKSLQQFGRLDACLTRWRQHTGRTDFPLPLHMRATPSSAP